MAKETYYKQLKLLLEILPVVSQEKCFALHGGTAFNLFIRNMPRVSVDIDLTYIHIGNREDSLQYINDSLKRIQTGFNKIHPEASIKLDTERLKLLVDNKEAQVKAEVNQINRGTLHEPEQRTLCSKAQEQFDTFCTLQVIEKGQLFGGKICAALDRQHPRDIFDIQYFLEHYDIDARIKEGMLLSLLSSNRPMHELLNPHLLDQRNILQNQFAGMTDTAFTYEEYEQTRSNLISRINSCFTNKDRQFIRSFHRLKPDWHIYDFSQFPSIKWKLQNLQKLYEHDEAKYEQEIKNLQKVI